MDAIQLLTSDHRHVETLFMEAERTGGEGRRDAVESIIHDLSVHAAVEEQILYPTVRESIDGGERLADRSLQEHAQVKDALAQLDGTDADDPAVGEQLRNLKQTVEQHVQEEEGELFPLLQQRLPQDRLDQMGEMMEAAKGMAPTRPHPHAPDRPPGNMIAGPPAAMLDKIRDAARSGMEKIAGSRR